MDSFLDSSLDLYQNPDSAALRYKKRQMPMQPVMFGSYLTVHDDEGKFSMADLFHDDVWDYYIAQ